MLPLLAVLTLHALPMSATPAFAFSSRAVVLVNGTPVTEDDVFQALWESYGPQTLEVMVNDLLLRQEVLKKNISISSKEIDKRWQEMRQGFGDLAAESSRAGAFSLSEDIKAKIQKRLLVEKLIVKQKHLYVEKKEIEQAFAQHQKDLDRPEQVHLRAIIVADAKQAQELSKEITQGAAFDFLAAKNSLDPTAENGGDLGWISNSELPLEIAFKIFAMKKGEIQVFPLNQRWAVIESLDKRPAHQVVYSEVKDMLHDFLLSEKVNAALPGYLQELRAKAEIIPQGGP